MTKWRVFGMLFSGKLNKLRTIAMLLIFLGIGLMYAGLLWRPGLYVFLSLGILMFILSTAVYILAGTLSNMAPKVVCPRCQRVTKVVGKTDECLFCGVTLTFDPKYAPKEEENAPSKTEQVPPSS